MIYKKDNYLLFHEYNKIFEQAIDPLTFLAKVINSTIQLYQNGLCPLVLLYYKINDSKWLKYEIDSTITLSNLNDKISFISRTSTFSVFSSENNWNFFQFKMTGQFYASGMINSLINYKPLTLYCFFGLFYQCNSLINITNLKLPTIKLANNCYHSLFNSCLLLTSIPLNLMPEIILSYGCFNNMFYGCKKLSLIPTNLFKTLEIKEDCYLGTFCFCNNITKVQSGVLKSTSLCTLCYKKTFYNCVRLNEIHVNFKNFAPSSMMSTYNWLYNTASSGSFYGPKSLSGVTRSENTIPENWLFIATN